MSIGGTYPSCVIKKYFRICWLGCSCLLWTKCGNSTLCVTNIKFSGFDKLLSTNCTWVLEIRIPIMSSTNTSEYVDWVVHVSRKKCVETQRFSSLASPDAPFSTHNGHQTLSHKMFCGSVVPSFLEKNMNPSWRTRMLGICQAILSDRLRHSNNVPGHVPGYHSDIDSVPGHVPGYPMTSLE